MKLKTDGEEFSDCFSELVKFKDCSVESQFSLRSGRWRIRFADRLLQEDRDDLQLLLRIA